MALVHCRECGEKISEQAPSCPKCGAPQQQVTQHKKSNKNGLVLAVVLTVLLGVCAYFFLKTDTTQTPVPVTDTRQDRLDVADRILSKNCQTLISMSTEYIKSDLVASVVNGLGERKCDCIKEKLKQKLADKYTLPELKKFEQTPIHKVQEIKTLVEANNEELKTCFPGINKLKGKIFKN